ncbi:hypothetical protein YC2023_122720 [Brassica napus]
MAISLTRGRPTLVYGVSPDTALASRSVAALRVLCTGVSVSRWCTWLWFRLGLRFRESQIYLLKLLWWSLVEARGFVGGHAASRFPGLPVAARDVGGGAWWQRVVGSAARVAGVVKILAPFASYSGFWWCFLPTSLEFSALGDFYAVRSFYMWVRLNGCRQSRQVGFGDGILQICLSNDGIVAWELFLVPSGVRAVASRFEGAYLLVARGDRLFFSDLPVCFWSSPVSAA